MALDTETDVSELTTVQDSGGDTVSPANADFVQDGDADIQIGSGGDTHEVDIAAPDRAEEIAIHVDGAEGSFHVEVQFHHTSDFSGTYTQRDNGDNNDYAGDGSTDVFVRTAVASPYIRVRIVDDSGGSNTVEYSIYVR